MPTSSIIRPNRTKQALQEGKLVLGTMLAEIRQPAIMQLLVHAGFDFVIIDNEHGPFSIESIAELSRAGRNLGITPIVRVPDLAYPYLAQSLDAGAQGIMLPRVYSADQARQAVQIMKYPPMGMRGCALNRGHTDFQGGPVDEVMATANSETLLAIQIETAEAVAQIEEIAAIPGVDVTFVGPNDLSIALGVPGQSDSPVLINAIEKVINVCQQHNVTVGIQGNDMAFSEKWVQAGARMLSAFSETGLLINAGKATTSAIRGILA